MNETAPAPSKRAAEEVYGTLIEEFTSVGAAINEAFRFYVYSHTLQPMMEEMRLFGQGADVSPWEMVVQDIKGSLEDRFIRRIVCLWNNATPANEETAEDFCKMLASDKPRHNLNRSSWCLEYLIWSVHNIHPNLTDQQKEKIKELYSRVWEIASSQEYENAVKIRHKMLAHLARDIPLNSPDYQSELTEADLNFYLMSDWMQKSVDIFQKLAKIADLDDKNTMQIFHNSTFAEITRGIQVLKDTYREKMSESAGQLKRVSPIPSHADAMVSALVIWDAPDGGLFHAERVAPDLWRVFREQALGGVKMRGVIAQSQTLSAAKEKAEYAFVNKVEPKTFMLECESLTEAFRIDMNSLDEHNLCSLAILIVSTDTDISWDGYVGVNTPVQILLVSQGSEVDQKMYAIAEQFVNVLRMFGVPAATRISSLIEYQESIPIAPILIGENKSKTHLKLFWFAGIPDEGTPDTIKIDEAESYTEKNLRLNY